MAGREIGGFGGYCLAMRDALVAWIVVGALAAGAAAAESGPCLGGKGWLAEDLLARSEALAGKDGGQSAEELRATLEKWLKVNRQIAQAAGLSAALVVCDQWAVNAYVTTRDEPIRVTLAALLLLRDESVIAALLSHEYGHLRLDHVAKRREVASALNRIAAERYVKLMRRAWGAQAAARDAVDHARAEYSAFSVRNELEADDEGISVAGKAGFKPGAFMTLAMLVKSVQPEGAGEPFPSHPGMIDRILKSQSRVDDASHDQRINAVVAAKDIRAAQPLLKDWFAKLPESANAWYYQALLYRELKHPRALPAMELALSGGNPSLRQMVVELNEAKFWLCTELYRKNFKQESAWCGELLLGDTPELKARFLERTFGDRLVIGGAPLDIKLGFVRRADGRKFVTDDPNLIDTHGGISRMRVTPMWRPVRFDRCGLEVPCQRPLATSAVAAADLAVRRADDDPFADLRAQCRPPNCRIAGPER